MNNMLKTTLITAASLSLLTGCVTPGEDDPNAMTKQGAAGGALLGLTLGALTGDAELAMQGAIAGGVAGGVAGASADIQNNREVNRSNSRDEAIAQIGNQSQSAETQKAANWDKLDNFIGEWNVNIQTHNQKMADIKPLSASGGLTKTTEASVAVNNEQGVDLAMQFSYSTNDGYQLSLVNNGTDVAVNFAGEKQSNSERYNFYPTNPSDVIYKEINSADIHVELGFAGPNVWLLESYAYVDGNQQKLQTFRFTRS
ncbi:hypothetical protein EJ063_00150 [Vibrio aquaticus]|uniref:Glycine zipper domain-containing protein n=1 Tax=Vibrio aquaticus TaxID=2496559 RepID=A0A3S0N6V5_9VIBR|nr:hypothetical protein [Vibrio aquaticus]RTZ17231.1 hypothetical protein EJ063_00150 [Vibrio aquaticus]